MSPERNFKADQTAEQCKRNTLSLAEGVLFTFNSRQDFSKALRLAERISSDYLRPRMMLMVADAELGCGMDPAPIVDKVALEAKSSDSLRTRKLLYGMVASSQARMGHIEAALTALRSGDRYGKQEQPYAQIAIAIAQAKAGLDPSEMFAEAKAISGKMAVGSNNNDVRIVKDDYMKVLHLQRIALAKSEVGRDPLPTFTEAITLANRVAAGRFVSYQGLAENLAECGYFERALELTDLMKPSNFDRSSFDIKAVTLRRIAERQLVTGDIEGAIQTAMKANRTDVLAHIYAESAIAKAGKDEPSGEFITRALQLTDSEKHDDVRMELYAHIGQAQARNGMDASRTFTLALQKAEVKDNPERAAKAYLIIAENQALGGIDASSTFELAIQGADKLTDYSKEDSVMSIMDEIEQESLYEDIAEAALNSGYFDIAKRLADKIDSVSCINDDKTVKVLVRLATEEVKRGLTQAEIDSLNATEVHHLLSGTEVIRQAALYFGLDKNTQS